MASGSSKGFDFASDDILCSYEDYPNQEQSNGTHSDSPIASKEFNKNRFDSDNQEVIIMAVERSMKKHTDNVMRFLEGLSSRLSQLELYCYNLDKSIGEMRSDLTRDHIESDSKLKFLEKHLQEVQRSVQILRDKQELAHTQKELAKLQLARKESSSSHNSQQTENQSSTPDTQKKQTSVESNGQQLALVPAPQPPRAPEPAAYYLPPGPTQLNQTQYPQQQYQQHWTPQVQPGSVPAGSRPQVYPQYLPKSEPIQMSYSAVPPTGSNQPMTYSYGAPARTAQPQPTKPGYGDAPNAYMVYDSAPGSGGSGFYPPNQQQSGGVMARPRQQWGGWSG